MKWVSQILRLQGRAFPVVCVLRGQSTVDRVWLLIVCVVNSVFDPERAFLGVWAVSTCDSDPERVFLVVRAVCMCISLILRGERMARHVGAAAGSSPVAGLTPAREELLSMPL